MVIKTTCKLCIGTGNYSAAHGDNFDATRVCVECEGTGLVEKNNDKGRLVVTLSPNLKITVGEVELFFHQPRGQNNNYWRVDIVAPKTMKIDRKHNSADKVKSRKLRA